MIAKAKSGQKREIEEELPTSTTIMCRRTTVDCLLGTFSHVTMDGPGSAGLHDDHILYLTRLSVICALVDMGKLYGAG